MENEINYSPSWRRPEEVSKLRSMKLKKRALTDRLFSYVVMLTFRFLCRPPLRCYFMIFARSCFFSCESPSKKSRGNTYENNSYSCIMKSCAQPPPDDFSSDSTLMDLLSYKQPASVFGNNSEPQTQSSTSADTTSFFKDLRHANTSATFNSPEKVANGHLSQASPSTNFSSPLRSYLPSLTGTPTGLKTRRLTPTPNPSSPSMTRKIITAVSKNVPKKRKSLSFNTRLKFHEEENSSVEKWHEDLCVDWSLKSRILVTSEKSFGWTCNLKASEESSGSSAFVRCIDSESTNQHSSQLDTTLGAQFHQCCLYWQHPHFPTISLFPRASNDPSKVGRPVNRLLKLDENAIDEIYAEW